MAWSDTLNFLLNTAQHFGAQKNAAMDRNQQAIGMTMQAGQNLADTKMRGAEMIGGQLSDIGKSFTDNLWKGREMAQERNLLESQQAYGSAEAEKERGFTAGENVEDRRAQADLVQKQLDAEAAQYKGEYIINHPDTGEEVMRIPYQNKAQFAAAQDRGQAWWDNYSQESDQQQVVYQNKEFTTPLGRKYSFSSKNLGEHQLNLQAQRDAAAAENLLLDLDRESKDKVGALIGQINVEAQASPKYFMQVDGEWQPTYTDTTRYSDPNMGANISKWQSDLKNDSTVRGNILKQINSLAAAQGINLTDQQKQYIIDAVIPSPAMVESTARNQMPSNPSAWLQEQGKPTQKQLNSVSISAGVNKILNNSLLFGQAGKAVANALQEKGILAPTGYDAAAKTAYPDYVEDDFEATVYNLVQDFIVPGRDKWAKETGQEPGKGNDLLRLVTQAMLNPTATATETTRVPSTSLGYDYDYTIPEALNKLLALYGIELVK
jgi:hypothetical protein